MNDPVISINRQDKRIGCFNGFDLVRKFEDYQDEDKAVAEAKAWFRERTFREPALVYPKLRKMVVST